MAVRKYCQSDSRWRHDKLGDSNLTVSSWGCNITSICMGHSRLFPDNPITPKDAARDFKFTKDGLLIHDQDYPGFTSEGRQWDWSNISYLKQWIRSKDRFAVIAVNGNSHFVFAYYWGFLGLYIYDPIDGKKKLLKRHYEPSGFAVYHRK